MKILQTLVLVAAGAVLLFEDVEASHSKTTKAPKVKKTKAPKVTKTAVPTVTPTTTPVATTTTPVPTTTTPAVVTASLTSSTTASTATHATFGTVTSGSATCVVGDPAEYISTSDINWIYTNRMATDVVASKALIFDQIHANKGSLDYCVRWDSTDKLSLETAKKFQSALERQYKAWNNWLIGYDCWPYDEIKINMVGVAVRDASLLDWTDDSLGKIYVGDLDADGVPQCPNACYKHLNGGLHDDTTECSGTAFDLTLWPTLGLEGGFGSWWGENINAQNFLENIDEEELQILSHEIGHGFGLPDFYDNVDFPDSDPTDFPKCIMEAGASMTVTPGDGWMLRRAWENVKPRYFS